MPDVEPACGRTGDHDFTTFEAAPETSAREPCGICFAEDPITEADELCFSTGGKRLHQTLRDAGGEIEQDRPTADTDDDDGYLAWQMAAEDVTSVSDLDGGEA